MLSWRRYFSLGGFCVTSYEYMERIAVARRNDITMPARSTAHRSESLTDRDFAVQFGMHWATWRRGASPRRSAATRAFLLAASGPMTPLVSSSDDECCL